MPAWPPGFFLVAVPGCYDFSGNRGCESGGRMVHHLGDDFDDARLSIAAGCWVWLMQAYLRPRPEHPQNGD